MNNNSSDWIKFLHLTPHPEGGFFSETYRNKAEISDKEFSQKYSGLRNLATSIYFLLDKTQVSKLHRLTSDEIWYYHVGSSVKVHVFYEGEYTLFILGSDFKKREQLQVILPAGSIFGAELTDKKNFSLFGCMVSPGFHFDDFEIIPFDTAILQFPSNIELIQRLT